MVLIDNEKRRYVEAFEAVAPKVPPGGVVVADNMTAGPFEFDEIADLVIGNRTDDGGPAGGIAAYLDHLDDASSFETTLLPLGEGLAVSRRIQRPCDSFSIR